MRLLTSATRNFDRAIMAERARVNVVNCITLAAAHRCGVAVNVVADNKKCRALEHASECSCVNWIEIVFRRQLDEVENVRDAHE